MADKKPETIIVFPSPDLPPGSFVPGIGAEGAELPVKEAQALLNAGLVVKKPPEKE